jgi:putative oxidoreductase
MFSQILHTTDDLTLTLMRLALGVVFFAHGAQKTLGWFGGNGFKATMSAFTSQMGIPAPIAFLVIAAEFFGGLGLTVGLLGRVAALGVLCVMIGAVWMAHLHNGFFMNWYGNQKGEGVEYHLLAIALALAIAIGGSGAFSLDRLLSKSRSHSAGRMRRAQSSFSRDPGSDHRLVMGSTPLPDRAKPELEVRTPKRG